MSKLIAVEYCPANKSSRNSSDSGMIELYGAIGETLEEKLDKAKKEDGHVTVRFPLLGPGSSVRWQLSDYPLAGKMKLMEEGVLVDARDLYKIGKTPVSLYERRPLLDLGAEQIKGLFEKPHFFSTHSLKLFTWCFSRVLDSCPLVWHVKEEWSKDQNSKKLPLFVEAKFYGIDTVVTTYDPTEFGGVAIVVTVRPQLTEADIKDFRGRLCFRENVYIASHTKDYIERIDGVEVRRTPVKDVPKLLEILAGLTTARGLCDKGKVEQPEATKVSTPPTYRLTTSNSIFSNVWPIK